jgi:hypothetical protein
MSNQKNHSTTRWRHSSSFLGCSSTTSSVNWQRVFVTQGASFQNRSYWYSSVLFWDNRKHRVFESQLILRQPELFGRPSPSPQTSLKSESENFGLWRPFGLGLSVFVCLRIYTVKKSTFHKKIPKFQFFLFFPIIPFINHMDIYLL